MRGRAVRRQSVYLGAWHEWAPRKRKLKARREAVKARVLKLRTNALFRNWQTKMHNARLLVTFQTQRLLAISPAVHDELYYVVVGATYALYVNESYYFAQQAAASAGVIRCVGVTRQSKVSGSFSR